MPNKIRWFRLAFGFVFFGFFIFNLSKAVHFSNELVFHDDEFQHTHLAWNTFQGKVIYRDFFDSHGPLSAFFNSLLFKLKAGEVASVETLYFLRHVNLIAMGVTALFLFGCIYVLTKNVVWGFLAMALYTGTLSIKTSAFQIRPDGYVALFALGSLWLWLTRRRFLSGIFLGICLGFHPKFLPINLAVLAADFFILTKRKREGSVFTLLLGEFIVLGVISLWFLQKGAFQLAVEGQWVSNFERAYSAVIIKKDYFRLLRANRGFETGLFVFCVLNLIVILKQAFSKKNISFDSDILMSSIFSGAGLLFLFAPVWGHAVIFVVPISLVVFIALCGRAPNLEKWLLTMGLVTATYLSVFQVRAPNIGKELLADQLKSLEVAIKETRRYEPILNIWTSRCPAYVFNFDPWRYWLNGFQGVDFFNREVRFEKPINYVSLNPMFLGLLSPKERAYLTKNYEAKGCFWKRKIN